MCHRIPSQHISSRFEQGVRELSLLVLLAYARVAVVAVEVLSMTNSTCQPSSQAGMFKGKGRRALNHLRAGSRPALGTILIH